ncbi:hypothetical protein [Salinadaptatus halalkaliphilus]|nr:hypothetical protein [Salinadaptatus halalkaliphilus]
MDGRAVAPAAGSILNAFAIRAGVRLHPARGGYDWGTTAAERDDY